MDPAFLRYGRKFQELEFKPFIYEEAMKWLELNGIDNATNLLDKDLKTVGFSKNQNKEFTLAELYKIKNELKPLLDKGLDLKIYTESVKAKESGDELIPIEGII